MIPKDKFTKLRRIIREQLDKNKLLRRIKTMEQLEIEKEKKEMGQRTMD